jgi:hypothetical protein
MIDRKFARRLCNWSTALGLALIGGTVTLTVIHLAVLGVNNNLGLMPFAALLLFPGLVFLAIGGSKALLTKTKPPN